MRLSLASDFPFYGLEAINKYMNRKYPDRKDFEVPENLPIKSLNNETN